MKAPLLTGNDIALAVEAVQITIGWWKKQPRSGVKSQRLRDLAALSTKLSTAADHLNPYACSDDMPLDFGGEPIYAPMTERQQKAAIRSGATHDR